MKQISGHWQSTMFGMLGVLGFSLTLPATKIAIKDFEPSFVGLGRAIIAAFIAGLVLLISRSPKPVGLQWLRLIAIALGIVIGFPLLTSLAMKTVPAAHGAVVIGLLPLSTALFGALLAGERPRPLFWVSTFIGSLTIVLFSLESGSGTFQFADVLLFGAVLSAGFGYAEGARLSKTLGSWQTISWALVISAPLLVFPVYQVFPDNLSSIHWQSFLGFTYVSVVSMFLAFIFWYKGLSLGGIAKIGQLQLLQPFLTIFAASLILNELITTKEIIAALIVISCVIIGRKASALQIKKTASKVYLLF